MKLVLCITFGFALGILLIVIFEGNMLEAAARL